MNTDVLTIPGSEAADFAADGVLCYLPDFGDGKEISEEEFSETLTAVRTRLDEGLAFEAESLAYQTFRKFSLSNNQNLSLVCGLSSALEMQGKFDESFENLRKFFELSETAGFDEKINFVVRFAVAHIYKNDFSNAVNLLNLTLKTADKRLLNAYLVELYLALSLAYRESGEFSAAKNFAEKAMKYAREKGDWRGLAQAYHTTAIICYLQGTPHKSLEYFQTAVKIVGENHVPLLKAKLLLGVSATYSALARPQDSIANLEKAIAFFEERNLRFPLATAYNLLGSDLTTLGNCEKAKEIFNKTLQIASAVNHRETSFFLTSSAQLKLIQGKTDEAFSLLKKACEFSRSNPKGLPNFDISLVSAQYYLIKNLPDEAIFEAEKSLGKIKSRNAVNLQNSFFIILAEAFLQKDDLIQTEDFLEQIELSENSEDYLTLAEIARLRGIFALKKNASDIAVQHFHQSLSLFEMSGNIYKTACAKYSLAEAIGLKQRETALKHLTDATQIFRSLGSSLNVERCENLAAKLSDVHYPRPRRQSAGTQLLMLRLAEAATSREFLFRELVNILQQEGKATKILLGETGQNGKFLLSVVDGFIPAEGAALLAEYQEAFSKNNTEDFAEQKNLAVFRLRAPGAASAVLIISPGKSGTNLENGSPVQPLLRIVELGMEICALREKDRSRQPEKSAEKPAEKVVATGVSQGLIPGFIYSSPEMTNLVQDIDRIGSSDITVLITGESGTGKELISRAVHAVSRRKDKVFVPFNCTAVPKELTEGHLFGYKRGAFTGAVNDSPGMIRSADGGTLFLDEIGDLPLDVQPKILRFLQEGEVQPLGEKSPIKVDVRIIAATNMDIEQKIAQGLFREDLFYRLNVIRLRVPPLRERRSEIPHLVKHYLKYYSAKFGRANLSITPQAMDLLIAYDWVGNVRQLCNEVQRMVARAGDGEIITPQHLSCEIKLAANVKENSTDLPQNVRAVGLPGNSIHIHTEGSSLESAVAALEKQMIQDSLNRHGGNISRAAKELGLTRRGLYMKLERYKLSKAF